jgi:hypothetical protein
MSRIANLVVSDVKSKECAVVVQNVLAKLSDTRFIFIGLVALHQAPIQFNNH